MKKIMTLLCALLIGMLAVQAQNTQSDDYHADGIYYGSYFGIRSDGVTVNTGSLQYAVNYISEKGGGTLILWVGRYLTGSVELKSNVTIQLQEGAVLVGVSSPYDYAGKTNKALFWADGQENITITGMGVIDGMGTTVQQQTKVQMDKGYLTGTEAANQVSLIAFSNCKNVKVEGITMKNAFGHVQVYDKCQDVALNNLTVRSQVVKATNGVQVSGCTNVTCDNTFFDVTGFPVASKAGSKNVKLSKCTAADGRKTLLYTM